MKLTFPTLAEQALSAWQSKTKTTALRTIAAKFGGELIRHTGDFGRGQTYVFDDDTSLEVTGVGKTHKVTAHLP